MDDIKKVQLEILKEFHRVCRENNINYSLAYGTALGAVRHKGFIPWDDDVDVIMLRRDYIKLSKIWEEEAQSNYFLQSYRSDKNYPYPFRKIRDSNTTFIEEDLKEFDINHGIFIDVFIYDNIADNYIKRVLQLFSAEVIWTILKKDGDSWLRDKFFKMLDSIIPYKVKRKIVIKLEQYIYKLGQEESTDVANLGYGFNLIKNKVPKKVCKETKEIVFENYKFYIFEGIEDHLIAEYGNYKKLPPKEQRIPGHKYHKLSVTESYKKM